MLSHRGSTYCLQLILLSSNVKRVYSKDP